MAYFQCFEAYFQFFESLLLCKWPSEGFMYLPIFYQNICKVSKTFGKFYFETACIYYACPIGFLSFETIPFLYHYIFSTVGGIPGAQPLLLIGIILAGASTVLDPKSKDDNFMINKELKGISNQFKSLEVNLMLLKK